MSEVSSPVPQSDGPNQAGILSQMAVTGFQTSAPPEGHPADADHPVMSLPRARGLRLWPALVIVALQWLAIKVPPLLSDDPQIMFQSLMMSPMVGALLLAMWWLFASRVAWSDRGVVLLTAIATTVGAYFASDASFKQGWFPMGLIIYVLPIVTTACVAWLLLTLFLNWPIRQMGLLATLLLVWGGCCLLRVEGIDGGFASEFNFRWGKSAEDLFIAELRGRQATASPAPETKALKLAAGDWPGFRGAARDGRVTGVRIATDWAKSPPRQLWNWRIGPGWSSFVVVGKHLFTQEQRDKMEAVVCYDTETGKEIWSYEDEARFSETVAGPGPRATPTFHEGKLYALGATGLLNCLDAATKRKIWSRDILKDSGAKLPQWGFCSSPLVSQGTVIVYAGAPDGKAVLGYKASTGDLVWSAGKGESSYCSPQPARLDGVEQAIISTDVGLTAFAPASGKVLWQHDWVLPKGTARVVQPALVGDSDVLLGTGFTYGTRRVHLSRKGDSWSDEEMWTTTAIRPYFNDLVIHKGHIYGFDSGFLVCVSLEGGEKGWRARGITRGGSEYGSGQLVLLADQGLLLVITEKSGEVALVEASPDGHKVLGRFQALTGKTWNHPVVAHGKLFVRNGERMACYALPVEADGK